MSGVVAICLHSRLEQIIPDTEKGPLDPLVKDVMTLKYKYEFLLLYYFYFNNNKINCDTANNIINTLITGAIFGGNSELNMYTVYTPHLIY